MREQAFTVAENKRIAKDVYRMALSGSTEGLAVAGQFLNLTVDGCYLRRPISVHDVANGTLTIIYKVVGSGTQKMREFLAGKTVTALVGLGNGYDLTQSGSHPLLIGGGVGVPPLYLLAKQLRAQGKEVSVILGFNSKEDVFCEADFRALGCAVRVTTADGSYGQPGFVTDALGGLDYTYFYTCGPEPMLKAVYQATATAGEFSFEERMGCGFGVCLGCPCKTVTGYKRICKDGPVLRKEEILWAR